MESPAAPTSARKFIFGLLSILALGFVVNEFGSESNLPLEAEPHAAFEEEVLGPQLTLPSVDDRSAATRAPAQLSGPQTFRISTESEWYAAVAAAKPGDTLRLVTTINARLVYQADTDGVQRPGSSGEPGNPIIITADAGVWIDPGNQYNNKGALDVKQADHIHVIGVNIRNSQFGLRLLQVRGTAQHPVVVADNTVTRTGHNGIKIGAQFQTVSTSWSSHILVENNTVSHTGQTVARFGEGIYLGKGGDVYAWKDESHHITVRGNEVFRTTAEAIDVKPGTRSIVVEDNLLHDLAPIDGGAISAHYSNFENPKPNEVDSLVIRRNRIWNVNLDGVSGSNDWAIWVGQGGVVVEDNLIWGMRSTSVTRAVRIKSPVQFGPHEIVVRDNVFWTASGAIAEGSPSGANLVTAAGNLGPGPGLGAVATTSSDFVGPVPSEGTGGTADRGSGPGSGFALRTTEQATTTTSTTAPPVSSTAPTTTSATTSSTTTTSAVSANSESETPQSVAPTTTVAASSKGSTERKRAPVPSTTTTTTSTIGDAGITQSSDDGGSAAPAESTASEPSLAAAGDPEQSETGEVSDVDQRGGSLAGRTSGDLEAGAPTSHSGSDGGGGWPSSGPESGGVATSSDADAPSQLALVDVVREQPTGRGWSGLEVGFAGLVLVATTSAVVARKRQASFG